MMPPGIEHVIQQEVRKSQMFSPPVKFRGKSYLNILKEGDVVVSSKKQISTEEDEEIVATGQSTVRSFSILPGNVPTIEAVKRHGTSVISSYEFNSGQMQVGRMGSIGGVQYLSPMQSLQIKKDTAMTGSQVIGIIGSDGQPIENLRGRTTEYTQVSQRSRPYQETYSYVSKQDSGVSGSISGKFEEKKILLEGGQMYEESNMQYETERSGGQVKAYFREEEKRK